MSLNLIIGCGGSGITTMTELNRLLSQNPEMLPRMADEVFYLVVDTEKEALEKFKTDIASQMGAYEAPFTQSVQLSKGLNILSDAFQVPFVARYSGRKQDPGLSRLRENWWFDANGVPFLAPKVTNLIKGAGQCPPASYGLAWYFLEDIGTAVRQIVDKMVGRGNGDPNYLTNMNLVIVSGLAGGTGRGCWNLIAFKVREYLLDRYHLTVPPIGVFFEANVYANVAKENEGQDTSLKVNSLTGVSELSCWMVNGGKTGDDRFKYRLPSVESPERSGTDILKVDLELNPNSGAPVGSAYLICGRSPSANLQDNEQYHKMAGAALYAMIANPQIAARNVNDGDPYNSLAAATFEVDTLHIRKYFETRAQGLALSRLTASEEGAETAVSAFLAESPLNARVLNATDLKPNAGGTLYQRVAYALLTLAEYKNVLSKLPSDFTKWKLDKALKNVLPLVQGAKAVAVKKAVQTALQGVGPRDADGKPTGLEGKNAEAAVVDAMKRAYRGEPGQKPSVGRALEFLKGVRAEIQAAQQKGLPAMKVTTDVVTQEAPATAVEKTLKVYSKRSFKEMVTGVGIFNDDEIKALCCDEGGAYWGWVPQAVVAASYPEMKKAIEAAFAGALARIEKLIAGCEAFAECCRLARTNFTKDEAEAAGGEIGQDAFSLLFATPDRVDETLYRPDNLERIYHRKLMPIVKSRESLERSVWETLLIGSGVTDFISKAVDDGTLEKLGAEKGGAIRDRFTKDLTETVRKNVSLSEDFMKENFTFEKVLAGNLEHWNQAIADARGDGVRSNELRRMFERTLGATPRTDPKNRSAAPRLPEADELRLRIAASLAGTCAPWWIADTRGAHHGVMLFLPFELSQSVITRLEEVREEVAPHADFRPYGLSSGGGSPYSYTAFVNAGIRLTDDEVDRGMHLLDKISSLDYFREPEVMTWMQMAESESGDSIFSTKNANKGIGYLSPLYVKNKMLSGYRWKPWTQDDEAMGEALENQATELMLYAMLGMGLTAEQAKKFEEKLAPYGLKLPVLKLSEKGQTWTLARKTLRWSEEDGRGVENTECAWNRGKKLCTSVCNLSTLLRGKGRTGKNGELKPADVADGNALKALLETEARLFEDHVRAELGADYKELCKARERWIVSQRDSADSEDRPVYDALLKRSASK